MATLKAKNNTGEWETVADVSAVTTEIIGDLKMEIGDIGGEVKSYIDLSKYVGPNDNFVLILAIAENKSGASPAYFIWHKADGGNLTPHKPYPTSVSLTNGIFKYTAGNDVPVSYDENTQIFTLNDDTYKYIRSFTILYAGVKEA